jgi:hypothetical protein
MATRRDRRRGWIDESDDDPRLAVSVLRKKHGDEDILT